MPEVQVPGTAGEKYLPALTLQTTLWKRFHPKRYSKAVRPYQNKYRFAGKLVISHNMLLKQVTDDFEAEAGLDNLISKYRLMGAGEIHISDSGGIRSITLPLFTSKMEVPLWDFQTTQAQMAGISFSMPLIVLYLTWWCTRSGSGTNRKYGSFPFPLFYAWVFAPAFFMYAMIHSSKEISQLSQSRQRITGKMLVLPLVMVPSVVPYLPGYHYFHILSVTSSSNGMSLKVWWWVWR